MNPIEERLGLLRATLLSITKIVVEILQDERRFISELNRNQLDDGEKANGQNMPNYKPGSKSPSAPGKIKLFDTGEFHASIEPLFDRDEFELVSTDEKADILINRYGQILGLNAESLNLLRERVRIRLIARLNEIL